MNRVVEALDFPDLDVARSTAKPLVNGVAGFKVGLELFAASGPAAVASIVDLGRPVFVDVKLHDIPNTVLGAARNLASTGARWVTVHASGGREMMEAAVEGMGDAGVLAVTVLTSLGERELESIGVIGGVETQVVGLAELAASAGVEGLVCAPGDVAAIRAKGNKLTIFTPGVRIDAATSDDQVRVGTPAEAVAAGANYLVVGRPITRAADPAAELEQINTSLARIA